MERRHTDEPFDLVDAPKRYATFDSTHPALIDTIETADGIAGHLVAQEDLGNLQFFSTVGPDAPNSYQAKLDIQGILRECYMGGNSVTQARSKVLAAYSEQWTNTVYGPPKDHLDIKTY